jgi:stage V sporulation protein B
MKNSKVHHYFVRSNQLKRHPLIAGTLILTLTSLVTRLIGFFYRMYLARLFGEEGMGIFQLVSPVLALSFSVAAAAYQTAISKFVAEGAAKSATPSYKPLFLGLSVSLPLSFLCTWIVFSGSDWIAASLLLEQRTAPMLRIIAFSIPLSSVHACVNGYFFGIKKTGVPAVTQLIEQICRVLCVYVLSVYAYSIGREPSINVAVMGLAVGELISMLVSVLCVYLRYCQEHIGTSTLRKIKRSLPNFRNTVPSSQSFPLLPSYRRLMGFAIPLTANRIVLNLLHSVEAISIPACLRLFGYDTATSLSVYGVLTGMAMPMIFFPNALTGSISVLLLPHISESYAKGDTAGVKKTIRQTILSCSLMGILCMVLFLSIGRWMGTVLFHSSLAGHFILTLSFLCPFIYLDTTLSSIIQGLGMTGRLFVMNAACLLLRLGFIFLTVPKYGIAGYLWGILAGQILLTFLFLLCLYFSSYRKQRSP